MTRTVALTALLAALVAAASPGVAVAASISASDPVYGTAAAMTGSRTNLITATGSNAGQYDGKALRIDWVITPNADLTFTYTYTFTGFRRPGLSHVILDLTDDAVFPTVDPLAVAGASVNGVSGPVTLTFNTFGVAPSNPGFPAGTSITGVKFDGLQGSDPQVISFTSNRAPVWGDIFVKGGNNGFAYNPGLLDRSSADVLAFIARPNGVPSPVDVIDFAAPVHGVIPEPSSLALCGTAALAGLGLAARRSRRRP